MGAEKQTILIADDIEINRLILKEAFRGDYKIIEANNGLETIEHMKENSENISALLLDIVMPKMDGFDVLNYMAETELMKTIPVFLITADTSEESSIKAYEMGVVDVLTKPFNPRFIKRRVENILELYRSRHHLQAIVEKQTEEIMKQADKIHEQVNSMLDVLSSIIEFRDLESGEHVQRIRKITFFLMKYIKQHNKQFNFSNDQIKLISEASVMHDIGKIAISDSILNKPGKLTKEEFEIMKTHTVKGCEILEKVSTIKDMEIYRYCYDICRYHHERWDGRGYPDGLKGDRIPIWAQVVSIADVFDALLSKRIYKPAFNYEETVNMILGGECGAFNPILLESFKNCASDIYNLYYKINDKKHLE